MQANEFPSVRPYRKWPFAKSNDANRLFTLACPSTPDMNEPLHVYITNLKNMNTGACRTSSSDETSWIPKFQSAVARRSDVLNRGYMFVREPRADTRNGPETICA